MRVVQVIPQLPPAVNGLGDYARRLGGALAGLGFAEAWLVTDAAWRPGVDSPSPVAVLPRHDAAAFLAAVAGLVGEGGGETGMILHWVNYAYQKRGCPYWLVGALAQLRTRHPRLRLVTMFHELYADSPPWGSPFWLRGIQQRLAVRAAGLSHACATNTIHHHGCLARWTGRGAEIPRLPVFSNIGDPEVVPSFLAREAELVVFGGPGGRSRAYRSPFLATACRALGVTAIHDIGPRPQDMPERLAGVPVHRHGALPAAAVGALLLRVRWGAVDYELWGLEKSGIFAAYASHGVVPVQTRADAAGRGVADADVPMISSATIATRAGDGPGLAARMRDASRCRSLAWQARCFAALLRGVPPPAPPAP